MELFRKFQDILSVMKATSVFSEYQPRRQSVFWGRGW